MGDQAGAFFPELKLTSVDFLAKCLGPLPDSVAKCSEYMQAAGTKELCKYKYDPEPPEFGKNINARQANEIYVCIGVKASNYFMPKGPVVDG